MATYRIRGYLLRTPYDDGKHEEIVVTTDSKLTTFRAQRIMEAIYTTHIVDSIYLEELTTH